MSLDPLQLDFVADRSWDGSDEAAREVVAGRGGQPMQGVAWCARAQWARAERARRGEAAAGLHIVDRVQGHWFAGKSCQQRPLFLRRLPEPPTCDATAALEALNASAPATEQTRRRETELAKQRVRELRGELFSYGEVSLTREVLRRFIESPEVRLLLPAELQERQHS